MILPLMLKKVATQPSLPINLFSDGCSITAGQNADYGYPSVVFGLITGNDKVLHNEAVGGQRSDVMKQNYQAHLTAHYLEGYDNIATIQIGGNNVLQDYDLSVCYSEIVDMVEMAIATGYRVCVLTIIPLNSRYTQLTSLNNMIINGATENNYHCTNVTTDSAFNNESDNLNETYYYIDHLHLNTNGQDHLGTIIYNEWVTSNFI